MTNRTITAPSNLTGTSGGATFTNGSATVDDATVAGKRAIAYAQRHGWAVSGGIATAVVVTPEGGKPVALWTDAELKAYLDGLHIQYPSGASHDDLLHAVLDGFDMKAQGGSMANEAAGHLSETIGPEVPKGADPIPVPGDDEAKAKQWKTPQVGNRTDDVAPTVSVAPTPQTVTHPATATFSVTAAGTPTPTAQWQRQAGGSGAYVDIDGATGMSYTTPPTTVSGGQANNGDKYRVKLSNSDGETVTTGVALTVN
jgi:hypothetical protein